MSLIHQNSEGTRECVLGGQNPDVAGREDCCEGVQVLPEYLPMVCGPEWSSSWEERVLLP